MNSQQLAQLLNGRQYHSEITSQEEQEAGRNGLIVIFGYSDDCAEFRGAIHDELGAYEGEEFRLYKNRDGGVSVASKWQVAGLQEDIDEFGIDVEIKTVSVIAEWDPDDVDCSWKFVTEVPSEKFHIYVAEDLYCIGLVVAVADVFKFINSDHGK